MESSFVSVMEEQSSQLENQIPGDLLISISSKERNSQLFPQAFSAQSLSHNARQGSQCGCLSWKFVCFPSGASDDQKTLMGEVDHDDDDEERERQRERGRCNLRLASHLSHLFQQQTQTCSEMSPRSSSCPQESACVPLRARKYSPPRHLDSGPPLHLPQLNRLPTFRAETLDVMEKSSPKAKARMLNAKVKARRAGSPQRPRVSPKPAPAPAAENGGAGQRSRKKGFKPPDVRTIFQRTKDPRVREERGEGHAFVLYATDAWCDVCCVYIFQGGLTCSGLKASLCSCGMGAAFCKLYWKFTQQGERLGSGCKYTCHAQCREQVALDCHEPASVTSCQQLSASAQDQLNNNQSSQSDVEKEKELRTHLSNEEIRHRVERYNTDSRDHFKMTLNPSGTYTGFIKVQLDLHRPITVKGLGSVNGQEAFYLPSGSINTLHISSSNTVRQVIEALLRKFTVADNPAKFALFKRFSREEQVYTCKLSEDEKPLFLRLVAGPSTDALSFVLKEQQTGDVTWDAFTIPELQNFLRILEKEEQDQMDSITRRYHSYREKLEKALSTHTLGCPR
ncbi:hypothetical protein DNTS_011027 [Danionella cerebrum]|uniref:Ras-associating domain-containing protein n=1 Tax=Danionella cerebrum TaxID=2873325 RepID=A0A553PMY4_9TELE|nr:hypothetical protein DNTS_011027 [Danionella translucida]